SRGSHRRSAGCAGWRSGWRGSSRRFRPARAVARSRLTSTGIIHVIRAVRFGGTTILYMLKLANGLVTGGKYNAHHFGRIGDAGENLAEAILSKLSHAIRLGGFLNIIERRAAHDQLGDLGVHDHQFVDTGSTTVAGVT